MVWCCAPFETLEPEEGANNRKGGILESSGNGAATSQSASALELQSRDDLVSVTVPMGMQPGQTITVMAPDGSRTVKASIPNGLGPGDTFLVRLAKRREIQQKQADVTGQKTKPDFANALEDWMSPDVDVTTSPSIVEQLSELFNPTLEIRNDDSHPAPIEPSKNDFPPALSTEPELHESSLAQESPLAQSTESPNNATYHEQIDQIPELFSENAADVCHDEVLNMPPPQIVETNQVKQKLLLVQVPPGLSPGQILHVEVPGEDRTLSVQIPPNVDAFHVSYTPRLQKPISEPMNTFAPPEPFMRQPSPAGQKLLLVRVPPGTPAGTTLHVSVPDEPGRILAAQVPPGNVSEFHVSYEARPPNSMGASTRRGMLHPANPYANSTMTNNESESRRVPMQPPRGKGRWEGRNNQQFFSPENNNNELDCRDEGNTKESRTF